MIKPIKNNDQYEKALARIYALMQKDLRANSKESDELEVLSVLVSSYEQIHFPMPKPRIKVNKKLDSIEDAVFFKKKMKKGMKILSVAGLPK